MDQMTDTARNEIQRLHRFLQGWFRGELEADRFDPDFRSSFHPDLVLIPPGGNTLSVEDFCSGTSAAHGSNPDFRIAIRNVVVRDETADRLLVSYEEWQVNAKASSPPNNGRAATVLFEKRPDAERPLHWLHIHETWLPGEIMAAGPFDF